MKTSISVFLPLIIGCTTATDTVAAQHDTHVGALLDRVVPKVMSARQIPGIAVAVLRHDSLVAVRGYGVANLETGAEVTPGTVFQIASTTKPFTAMIVMKLVEDGRIDLKRTAGSYLGWLPEKFANVTVQQLLTHTSGIPRDLRRENVDEFSFDEFKSRLAAAPPAFEPGTQWQYSNTGYTILSAIVEKVTRRSFGAVLTQRIFAPLGMQTARYRAPERAEPQYARGYELVDGELKPAPHVFSGWGNSGIEASVVDLARWLQAVIRGTALSSHSMQLMLTPGRLRNGSTVQAFGDSAASYGFGWVLTRYKGEELISHGGAIAGFQSTVNWYRNADLSIIVLSNGKQGADRRGQADVVARTIADSLGLGAVSAKPTSSSR